jgi:hypothetical protein
MYISSQISVLTYAYVCIRRYCIYDLSLSITWYYSCPRLQGVGLIFAKFTTCDAAARATAALHGRLFDGKSVVVVSTLEYPFQYPTLEYA